jgi:peptidoglycan-associated lipoprotein
MRRVILLVLLAAGCAHAKQEPVVAATPPAPAVQATPPVQEAPAPLEPAQKSCRADDGCAADQLCLESRCVAIEANTEACKGLAIHFEFDRADVRADDFDVLGRAARCLAARPATAVRIEGNCDERGTTEYNVALGNRRAWAARKYLIDLGAPEARLEAISYGEEKPICGEATEACWATNRRGDLRAMP